MSSIHAKSIIAGKFWIVEENHKKVGILKLNDQQKYVFSSNHVVKTYDSKKKLFEYFGTDFFQSSTDESETNAVEYNIQEYPTSTLPYAPMFDVKRHLPLFSKSEKSKSIYCAGYYIIKFDKKWTKSFCPKVITLERYPYEGPFKTELEMKNRLSHVSK